MGTTVFSERKSSGDMSTLQAELMDMTKDLYEETLRLQIGMARRFVIPMENKTAMASKKKTAEGRSGQ